MTYVRVGRINGIELENWRSVSAKRDAVETNPTVFTKEETVEVYQDWYKTLGTINQHHPEFQADDYPVLQVYPDTGEVFADTEYET